MHDPLIGKSARFVAVGIVCALIYLLIWYAMRTVFNWSAFSATSGAYAVCFSLGYMGQRRLAFRSQLSHRISLPRYAALQTAAGILTAFITEWITRASDFQPLVSSVLATVVAGMMSFFVSAFWVFRES